MINKPTGREQVAAICSEISAELRGLFDDLDRAESARESRRLQRIDAEYRYRNCRDPRLSEPS